MQGVSFNPLLPSSPLPRLPHPYGSSNHMRAPPGFRAAMGRLRASSPLPPPVPAALLLLSSLLHLSLSPLPPTTRTLVIPPLTDGGLPEREITTLVRGYVLLLPHRDMRWGRVRLLSLGLLEVVGDTWVDPRETAEEVAPLTLEGVNTRVTELTAVQEQDTQEIYAVIEDTQDRQTRIYQTVETFGNIATDLGGSETSSLEQARCGCSRWAPNNMPPKRTVRTARTARVAAATATATAARLPIDYLMIWQLVADRVSAALANHDTLRNNTNGHSDGSHNSGTRT
ncbi:hypothetical protein Tco_0381031 [Tanacetum coccineum]